MGRQKFNKRDHLEKSNRIFESRNKKIIINEQQLGDSNNDGVVDQTDIDYVTNNWLQPGDVYDSNDGIINLDDLSLVSTNFGQGSATSLPSQTCDTCDSTQWSNAGSWYSTVFMAKITSLGGYVNGAPVNPAPQACEYICERLGIWNSKCPTAGPVQQNQLACKIESGQYESGAHGCACQTDPNTGTACDISWNTPCADNNLNTGGENSWTQFLSLRQTGWDSVGCQHLQNVVNWNTSQLNSGVNSAGVPLNNVQISRKNEQIAWAQCQANECGCPSLNVPPLTGGPTPTGNNSHENFTGTVCNCVGDCSSPTSQVGAGFQAASATHQCNGQMCTDTGGPNGTGDIGEIFDYDDGAKTLTFTLNSFSNPGIFGVSETPGINMPTSTCPVTPVAPPNPLAGTGGIKPEKKEKEEKEKEEKNLKEEFTRMKTIWKYRI